MKQRIFLSAFLSSLILIASPAISQKKKMASIPVQVTGKDNRKTIWLKVNHLFNVLFTNECVGCAQVWKTTVIDPVKVKFLSTSYSNKSCQNCTGGRQDNTFHFVAKKAGISTLSFQYFDSTFSVKIVTKK